MKMLAFGAACLATALASTTAQAVVIDFSDYTAGTRIDGPLTIGDATFNSTSGTLLIDDFGAGNAICAFDGTGCSAGLAIEFVIGATGLSFDYSGDDVAGSAILFEGQSRVLAFRGLSTADGDPTTRDAIRIRFEAVTFLSLISDDPGGVGFGNFVFTTPGAVPEPATWAAMMLGFGLAGGALRARRATPLSA